MQSEGDIKIYEDILYIINTFSKHYMYDVLVKYFFFTYIIINLLCHHVFQIYNNVLEKYLYIIIKYLLIINHACSKFDNDDNDDFYYLYIEISILLHNCIKNNKNTLLLLQI